MFVCPRCRAKLLRQKDRKGVFWHCQRCGGRTASLGLLRKLVSPHSVKGLWKSATETRASGPLRCPACGKSMVEVPVPPESGLEHLDVCKSCQFVWFDALELDRLPKKPVAEPESVEERLSTEDRRELALMNSQVLAQRKNILEDTRQLPDAWWQWIPALFGLPIEHEKGALSTRPFVTWTLAVAATLIGVAALIHPGTAIDDFALIPAKWTRHGGLTVLTAFFIHGGAFHLIGNMYFLLVFGDNVEDYLGHLNFLAFVAIATAAGGAAHIIASPESTVPCIGASGGISGVITFYALKFPRARLGIIFWFHWIRLPAIALFFFWGVAQAAGMVGQLSGMGHVSYMAHMGGVLVGFSFWLMSLKK